MNHYLIRKEIDYYIVYDYALATFFTISLNNFFETIEVGEQKIIKDKNLWEYESVERLNYSERLSNPIVVGLQITDKCNLRCKYCIAKNDLKLFDFSQSNQTLIKNVIEKLNPMAVWISGGEPTLNNDLIKIIALIQKTNANVGIVVDTNGVSIPDFIIDSAQQKNIYFRVSLDSHLSEIHNFTRGYFDKTYESIIKFKKTKISFGVTTVVHNLNLDSLLGLSTFLKNHEIKRHTLLELREGFTECADKLIIQNTEKANKILNDLFQLNKANKIFTTFIKGTINKSSTIISPYGEIFTSNPSKGDKFTLCPSINKFDQSSWENIAIIDAKAHQSKYLGIINNFAQNGKITFYQ